MNNNHEKLAEVGIRAFKKNGLDIEILELTTERDLLKVVARASKGGVEIPVNNPLYYKNPPIRVDRESEENPEETLKEIICQTIWRH